MSENLPLISIIMAVKDTEPYLPACLDSILAQDYPNWELIAVNDHSSDRTPEILAEYAAKDNRVKVFHSDQPKLIPTLQYGYQFIQGDLVNRMDSDDKMPADKLSSMYHEYQKYGAGHVIAGGTEHFVDEGEVGDGFRRYERWLNEVARTNTHKQQIYTECVIPSHCWLIAKADLDAVGAFDSDIYPEDYDLCFRFYKAGLNIVGMDKILHYWRDRSDRISRTWEVYKDNRYFDLKMDNFLQIDREYNRPLVLWGGGRNGKDMAKLLLKHNQSFTWVCDNENKIGHNIYGTVLQHWSAVEALENPQIIIVVASPDGKAEIQAQLNQWDKKMGSDYWFFA